MYFKHLIGLCIFCFIATFNSAAKPNSLIEEFTIKPGLCIVEEGKPCKQSFIFFWRLTKAIEACIFREQETLALFCEQKKHVEVTLYMDITQSDEFILRAQDSQLKHAILVRQLTRDIRQVRRHVWSVF